MTIFLISFAFIIFWCLFLNKIANRIGVPSLLLFILLGLFTGWTENVGTEIMDEVGELCSIALIFIMFYGGFGTNWKTARPVVTESGLLATVGVFLTAGVVGCFCHFGLGWELAESFLMGAVISSTDAATVFSILRTHNLGLRHHTAPILEIESGSNDPCSYMLTVVLLTILQGSITGGEVAWMIFSQLVFGAACGLLIAWLAIKILKRNKLPEGFDMMFFIAIAILAYALPNLDFIDGNGYLSTYIVGIVLGNTEFHNRKAIVHFFDGTTSLCQIVIFYCLGYICHPSNLYAALLPAVLIFFFITLIARPVAVGSILLPFRKYRQQLNQIGLVSFVGLRGAASIVFAIMTLTTPGLTGLNHDVFSIVFVIVLISILLQGSFIPAAAKSFDMIDKDADVRLTFTDFSENSDISFGRITLDESSSWNDKIIKELHLPKEILISLIIRDNERIIPKGHTRLRQGDNLIISSKSFNEETEQNIIEHRLSDTSEWIGRTIKDFAHKKGSGFQIILIKRGSESIIPNGDTVFMKDDTLMILKFD